MCCFFILVWNEQTGECVFWRNIPLSAEVLILIRSVCSVKRLWAFLPIGWKKQGPFFFFFFFLSLGWYENTLQSTSDVCNQLRTTLFQRLTFCWLIKAYVQSLLFVRWVVVSEIVGMQHWVALLLHWQELLWLFLQMDGCKSLWIISAQTAAEWPSWSQY